jgi:hypothetical protein
MLTTDETRSLAEAHVRQVLRSAFSDELVISSFEEFRDTDQPRSIRGRNVEHGEIRFALAGNGPLFVDRETGAIRRGRSGPLLEDQLD